MTKLRRMLSIVSGNVAAEHWMQAALEEPPVHGPPRACNRCPLRKGGEWEAGARAAIAQVGAVGRKLLAERWGCHEADRPCAGMQRLTREES